MAFVPSEYSYGGIVDDLENKARAYKAIADVNAIAVEYAAKQKAAAAKLAAEQKVSDALAPAAAAAEAARQAAAEVAKVLGWLPWIGAGVVGWWLLSDGRKHRNPGDASGWFAEDLRASIDEPIRTAREISAAKGLGGKARAYRHGAGRALEHVTVGQLRRVPRLLAMFGIPT